MADFDSLRSRRDDGDETDEKQAERGERCKEPDDDSGAGGQLYTRYPPLVKAHCVNAESLKFLGQHAMAFRVEQLVVARNHKERSNRDAVEGERDVGPSDTIEQYIYHCCCSFRRRYV